MPLTKWQRVGALAALLMGWLLLPRSCFHDVDEGFYPYKMTAIRASVFLAGGGFKDLEDIPATYDSRISAVSECQDAARDYARANQLDDGWSYVCCTITQDSSCKTKVR
jgi:hypothetical protein